MGEATIEEDKVTVHSGLAPLRERLVLDAAEMHAEDLERPDQSSA